MDSGLNYFLADIYNNISSFADFFPGCCTDPVCYKEAKQAFDRIEAGFKIEDFRVLAAPPIKVVCDATTNPLLKLVASYLSLLSIKQHPYNAYKDEATRVSETFQRAGEKALHFQKYAQEARCFIKFAYWREVEKGPKNNDVAKKVLSKLSKTANLQQFAVYRGGHLLP